MEKSSLIGKTVIITGASAGIGKETALAIANTGARTILACRNLDKANAVRDALIKETGNSDVHVRALDLASLGSVRQFAEDFNEEESRLDILINNAGVSATSRRVTEDGFELHFQVNHLGHFLLTHLLLDKLKASAPSRIVIVASDAHRYSGKLDLDNLQLERGWSSFKAYARSKTMNILYAVELGKQLEGSGVSVHSLHPGMVQTELGRESQIFQNKCFMWCVVPMLSCCFGEKMKQPKEGAATTLYCALEPSLQGQSGRYYRDSQVGRAKPYATDEKTARTLWEISASLCGLDTGQTDAG